MRPRRNGKLGVAQPASVRSSNRACTGTYNPKEMAGLPVSVQVVGKQYDDERAIELMKVVDKALGRRGSGLGEFAKRQQAAEKLYKNGTVLSSLRSLADFQAFAAAFPTCEL
ncbi:hypothetical protein JCM10908_004777 [Rhodotorula pacifica]|uniref:uncharacterized protein n=1 Tax=Rhodotorula pacifica TaxID=1495444 RepID=UPI00317ACF89